MPSKSKPQYLSKTRFISGLQCPKRLYLQVHPPNNQEKVQIENNLPLFNGHAVGEMACQLYPGVMVEYEQGLSEALKTTRALIADETVLRIHEATFCFQNILVRVDLLERTPAGWILTEVKASTGVKLHYLNDAAVQAWVLQGCGLSLDSVCLMHVNNQFVAQGDGNYEGLLHSEDISDDIFSRIDSIQEQSVLLTQMLDGDLPQMEMGNHCNTPYACEFQSSCRAEELPKYPLSALPRLHSNKREQLQEQGYRELQDIPEGILTNLNHQRVWKASCEEQEAFTPQEAKVLHDWSWPRHYLDFETIALAVPRWKGVRPYVQVPFQWSCHIHNEDGSIEHHEFLDVSGNDPQRSCAEALVQKMGAEGIFIAYSAGFEKKVIRELASRFPDLAPALLDMESRFVDLLPITRNSYYHPSQKGSWSIKAVLPALVPELSYADLEGVQNGSDAQLAWIKASQASRKEQIPIEQQLLKYCKLDTWAMLKIVEALLKKLKREKKR